MVPMDGAICSELVCVGETRLLTMCLISMYTLAGHVDSNFKLNQDCTLVVPLVEVCDIYTLIMLE